MAERLISVIFSACGHYIPLKVRKFLNKEENKNVVFNFWAESYTGNAAVAAPASLTLICGYLQKDDMEFFHQCSGAVIITTETVHPLAGIRKYYGRN